MAQRRTLVGAAALGVVLAACSASSTSSTSTTSSTSSTSGTVTTAVGTPTTMINGESYDASPFCVNARLAEALDQATQDVDVADTGTAKKIFDAAFVAAKDNAANAPASLKADYATYVTWLTQFNASLAQHGYKLSEAVADEQLVKLADEKKIKAASEKVNTYKQAACGIGVPVTTTSSSAETVAP